MSEEGAPEATADETGTEETEATKTAAEHQGSTDSGLPDDPEVLKGEIAKLRKENAAKRTKAKEDAEAAKKWKEHVDSQKSELEKLQDTKSEIERELSTLRTEKLQKALATEHGVPDDLAEFIVGADADEMAEKAKKLAASVTKKSKTTAADMRAGKRGGEVASKSEQKWLNDLLKG